MNPIFLTFGPITIHTYGLVFALGILAAPVHPTQLYSSFGLLVLMVILLEIRSRARFPGGACL